MIHLMAVCTAILTLTFPVKAEDVKTPFLAGWDQTPLSQLERQAAAYPDTFFLQGTPSTKAIAFTYDDGPSAYTLQLLKVLKKHNVKASFFWLGSRMLQYPDIVRMAEKAGHMIASHSYSHARSTTIENQHFLTGEIEQTQQVFFNLVGSLPSFYRPPYGDMSDKQIELLAQRGMKISGWTINTDDWLHNTKPEGLEKIKDSILTHAHPGAVVLMHDGGGERPDTVRATDELIPLLKAQGYQFQTVASLLGISAKQ